ncbi:MAG: hypothetical protein DWP94_03070 [Flavobacterium sp.]|nr:MAG: hypothetical protein DWP94_03070 [Flavobacterium sp.]
MKRSILVSLCLILYTSEMIGQEAAYLNKVDSVDNLIDTLYGVISGEKNEARDWELFRFLFTPEAKLIPSVKNKDGVYEVRYMSPENYIESAGKWFMENGFYEKELFRKTESFGNITHIFSTYESFKSKTDTKPFMRGINSIQLLNDGERWWIVNIYWTQETDNNPIPQSYLPH